MSHEEHSPERNVPAIGAGRTRAVIVFSSEAGLPKCGRKRAVARANLPRKLCIRPHGGKGLSNSRVVRGPCSCIVPCSVRIPKTNPAKKSSDRVFWGGRKKSPPDLLRCCALSRPAALPHSRAIFRKEGMAKELEESAECSRPTGRATALGPRPTFFASTPKNSPFFSAQKSQKSRKEGGGLANPSCASRVTRTLHTKLPKHWRAKALASGT